MKSRASGIAALGAGALALALGACGSSDQPSTTTPVSSESASQLAPVSGTYAPVIKPADFSAKIDNPWFPLKPGTTTRADGVAENGATPQVDVATVTKRTKRVDGVDCVVVRDVVSENGAPIERTFDWYAQDRAGNVWYFGEDSSEIRNGQLQPSGGSFAAGADGAHPGIIMPANPKPGDAYRQEYYPGHALDQAKIVGYSPVSVPYGRYRHTLTTVETTALEPGVREEKHYVRGIGEVASADVAGSKEAFRLVGVKEG